MVCSCAPDLVDTQLLQLAFVKHNSGLFIDLAGIVHASIACKQLGYTLCVWCRSGHQVHGARGAWLWRLLWLCV